jgi:hypothetical protein
LQAGRFPSVKPVRIVNAPRPGDLPCAAFF